MHARTYQANGCLLKREEKKRLKEMTYIYVGRANRREGKGKTCELDFGLGQNNTSGYCRTRGEHKGLKSTIIGLFEVNME